MESTKKNFNTMIRFLKQFLLIGLIIVIVTASVGIFIYALYRIALISRTLYSWIFLSVMFGFIMYFVARSISRKIFSKIILQFAKFFFTLILILFSVSLCMLYAAFILRYPQIGIIITPGVVFIIIFTVSRWNLFSWIKNIYNKL